MYGVVEGERLDDSCQPGRLVFLHGHLKALVLVLKVGDRDSMNCLHRLPPPLLDFILNTRGKKDTEINKLSISILAWKLLRRDPS